MPPLSGFTDVEPSRARLRRRLINQLASAAERYGFSPIETPTIEPKELLLGKYGAEADKLLYEVRSRGDKEMALRYDLTVSLQRFLADHQNLPIPFRRYQTGQVFRAESPQIARARLREFTQFDVDVIGSSHPSVVAECLAYLVESLELLTLGTLEVKLNSRKILDGLAEKIGIEPSMRLATYRLLDKLEHIGAALLSKELSTLLTPHQADELLNAVTGDSSTDLLHNLEQELKGTTSGPAGIHEIREIVDFLTAQSVPEELIVFTPSLARGLDYYTGAIFETQLLDVPELGSVASGGVYDQLIRIKNQPVPACGFSFGIDRLVLALEESANQLTSLPTNQKTVLVTLLEGAELASLELAALLRQKQLSITLPIPSDDLGKQLRYADRISCAVVVILGKPELGRKIVKIKSLTSGEQTEVSLHDLAAIEKAILAILP